MRNYKPIMECEYGELDPKVDLLPDFFTGFDPARRKEIVTDEAKFYHSITAPYSVDNKLAKYYVSFKSYDDTELQIKVYRPKNVDKVLPAYVFIHGGGFMTCSVETHDFVPSYIAVNAGVMAFSIEYRLAPEYKFPIGLKDCYSAIKWIYENAEKFNIDPNMIAVSGDSSGGTFAAALCLMARERGEFKLWKQVLIYPACDIGGTIHKHSADVYTQVGSKGDQSPKDSPVLKMYLKEGEDLTNPMLSPMLADNFVGLPPALFIEAECDALVDDGLMYAKCLQDDGVPVECSIYKGMPHAFILRTYEETFAALEKIVAFLKK